GLAEGPIAVVGASVGALVALSVVASGQPPVSAIALVSPALRLGGVGAAHGARTLAVAGADDDADGFARPAEELAAALVNEHVDAAITRIPNMGHAIADEPGLEPATQTARRA